VLEPRQRSHVGDALANRRLQARGATDFPNPWRSLGKHGRMLRSDQSSGSRNAAKSKKLGPSHGVHVSTVGLTTAN
jgi:hypothetical protein